MSEITGNTLNTITKAEHDDTGGANTKKVLTYGWDGTNKVRLKVDSTGRLDTTATVQTGDIEIGAVEIKNATDDTRAIVTAAGAVKVDGSAVTQPVSGTFYQATQPVSIASETTIYNGQKTVTTAGTQVALASSQAVKYVIIKALPTNTGKIYVGDSNVDSTTGYILSGADDAIGLSIANLATVYIDSQTNGEGVSYIAAN